MFGSWRRDPGDVFACQAAIISRVPKERSDPWQRLALLGSIFDLRQHLARLVVEELAELRDDPTGFTPEHFLAAIVDLLPRIGLGWRLAIAGMRRSPVLVRERN